jgi:hypothetical protein
MLPQPNWEPIPADAELCEATTSEGFRREVADGATVIRLRFLLQGTISQGGLAARSRAATGWTPRSAIVSLLELPKVSGSGAIWEPNGEPSPAGIGPRQATTGHSFRS